MPALLAIVPHPDDESYAFGGTIALAADAGWRCLVACASSGERGKRHDGGAPGAAALAACREAELAASCAALGAAAPAFWRLPDGRLRDEDGLPLARNAIEESGAAMILALGADGAYGHPDHLAVYRWVVRAWQERPEPRPPLLLPAFARGLFLPQYERCVGMMGDPPSPPREAIGALAAEYAVDIRRVASRKRAAVAAHRSQLPGGDPEALFPRGIVAALMAEERFTDASGARSERTAELLAALGG